MAKKYTEEVAQIHTEAGVQQAIHSRSLEDDCPIPHPEELQRFKDVDPRLVEFFMEQSRQEQIQRHKAEDQRMGIIRDVSRQEYRVSISGLVIMLVALVTLALLSAYCLYLGHNVAGISLAAVDLVGGLSVFSAVIKNFQDKRNQH